MLYQQQCQPLAPGHPPLAAAEREALLKQVSAKWCLDDAQQGLLGRFEFQDYYQTIAFVNSVAWIAQAQDHHPELQVAYKECVVHYSTHSIGGLSLNDFICAARIDQLFA